MSEIDHFLGKLDRSLPYADPLRAEVGREARDHLFALVDRYRRDGMTQSEAESRALDSFGSVDDFVTRFEAQGGPTTASVPTTGAFTIVAGAYAGIVLGIGAGLVIGVDPQGFLSMTPGILGLVLGALCGRGLILQRNLGPFLGAAMGALVGNVAIAHVLFANYQQRFGESAPPFTMWCTAIGALCGIGIGFVPRLRNDPTPLLWATALGIGGHVAARTWLESEIGVASLTTLVLGLIVGGALGLHRLARRYAPVPLGGMAGLMSAWLLYWVVRHLQNTFDVSVLSPNILPPPGLIAGTAAGVAIGLAFALRSEPGNFRPERAKIGI